MKGVVFNLLEAFVIESFGEDKWDEIHDLCPLQTTEPFVGPKTYPDADLFSLVSVACSILEVPPPAALRAFGVFSFPHLAARFPVFLEGFTSAKDFLLSVDGVIHVEVAKLMEGSVLPKFEYSDDKPQHLVIRYTSQRALCHFMEGLLDGVAAHFGETLEFSQRTCLHEDGDCCTFDIEFKGKSNG